MRHTPFHAVRVVVRTAEMTWHKDYVRGELRVGKVKFDADSLGAFLMLLRSEGKIKAETPVIVDVFPVEVRDVIANRKYHHTTH